VAWTLGDLAGRDRPDESMVRAAILFKDRRAA
jgi:magnesium chelatase family protein